MMKNRERYKPASPRIKKILKQRRVVTKHRRFRSSAVKSKKKQRLKERVMPQKKGSYEEGYEQGLYEGGEKLYEQALPPGFILPDISLGHVIQAGVEALRSSSIPLLNVGQVFEAMESAITAQAPCAVVRLGDGELFALSQDLIYDANTIKREAPFLPYAGVTVPDLRARNLLAYAVMRAHIVGIPLSRKKSFQPFLFPVLRGHGINVRELKLTESTINYSLYSTGLLQRLLQGRNILVIGNAGASLASTLRMQGYSVAGSISPVRGFDDIDRVMQEASGYSFDLALVAAGIPAVVIAWRIADQLSKTALDFGHMADQITKGVVHL